jgi:hypothetical protein
VDELQDLLTRLGLDTLAEYGFALAGGYALQAHRLVDRISEDIDLFTDRWDPNEFSRAVEAISEAYRRADLETVVIRQAATFARLQVTDTRTAKVALIDLAADFRDQDPVRLSVGRVLSEPDAVASKVATVFSRGEARDYLDLAGILESGRFSRDELMTLARTVDAGFSEGMFAGALAGIDRFADDEFVRYGVDADRISHVRVMMREWSKQLQQAIDRAGRESTSTPTSAEASGQPSGDSPRTLPPSPRHQSRRPGPRVDPVPLDPSREPPGIDL